MSEQESRIRLHPEWLAPLRDEFEQPYMRDLRGFLRQEHADGRTVYPPGGEMFAALDAAPLSSVRVVILGQDPYHGPGQAHGLCFSVRKGQRPPPSLQNIFTELREDLGLQPPRHGDLSHWAQQGVLLLNSVLTVEAGQPGSHQGKGWEGFTDHAIETLAREREDLVFLLWGAYAQAKGKVIDTRRHRVLRAPHPSPLSAHRGFLGCGHFSATNQYLAQRGKTPIDWRLPPRDQLVL